MSMPIIAPPANPISFSQAVTDLIESIALEEAALAHILNAEGEKLQKAMAMCTISVSEMLEVNNSVQATIASVAELEQALKNKLEFIANNLYFPPNTQSC